MPHVLERGVRVGGSDAWCRGALFVHAEDKYAATPDAGLIGAGETQSP